MRSEQLRLPSLSFVTALARSERARNALTTNALSSLGNFGLTFAIVRSADLTTVGKFALAFAIYAFATAIAKAGITESVLSAIRGVRRREDAAHEVSLVGLVLGSAIVVGGLLAGSPFIILTGVAMHGILVYDFIKVTHMALLESRVALRQELAWTGLTFAGVAAAVTGVIDVVALYGVWAVSCAVIGYTSAGVLRIGILPRWPSSGMETKLTGLYALDQVIGPGAILLTTYLLAGLSGLAVVGALRAAAAFFSPLTIVSTTGHSLGIPLLSRARELGPRHELRSAVQIAGVQIAVLGPLALLITALPLPFLTLVVGANAAPVRMLLLPLAIDAILNVASTVALSGHRAERAGLRTVLVFAVTAPIRLVIILTGAHYAGALGAAWATALTALIGMLAMWWSYHNVVMRNAAAQS